MYCIALHYIALQFSCHSKRLKVTAVAYTRPEIFFVLFCPDDGVPSLIVSFRITQFCVTVPRLLPNVGFVSRSRPRGSKY